MATNFRFFVVFDSGFRPEYVNDVHEIVCLPPGCHVTYNYNVKYLSEEAIAHFQSSDAVDTQVLLMFWQPVGAVRGESWSNDPASPYIIFPTRIATISSVDLRADKVHFTLKLKGFPMPNAASIASLASSFRNENARPPKVFVSVSFDEQLLESVAWNYTTESWRRVVNRFQEQTHFRDDSFLYIGEPTYSEAPPKGKQHPVNCESGVFLVPDCAQIALQIENLEPTHKRPTRDSASRLEIATSTEEITPRRTTISLRQYGLYDFNFETAGVMNVFGRCSDIEVSIQKAPGDGHGPATKLRFRIRKRASRWLIGISATVLGTALVIGVTVKALLAWPWIFWGILLLVMGPFVLTGRAPKRTTE